MLIPWRPFLEPFGEMEKFFEGGENAPIGFSPAVDIYEKGNNVIVEAPLPGIDPDKVEISVEDNILSLKGKMEKKSEVEDKNYYRRETRSGSFSRHIPLPVNVKGDKASAIFDDGLLKVSVPKMPEKKVKKVDIKVKKNKK